MADTFAKCTSEKRATAIGATKKKQINHADELYFASSPQHKHTSVWCMQWNAQFTNRPNTIIIIVPNVPMYSIAIYFALFHTISWPNRENRLMAAAVIEHAVHLGFLAQNGCTYRTQICTNSRQTPIKLPEIFKCRIYPYIVRELHGAGRRDKD